jgi:hypothetical protein
VVGTTVHFEVTDGPHKGRTATAVTNSAGEAEFTYTGTAAGVDEIIATFVDSQTQETKSATATVTWEGSAGGPPVAVDDAVSTAEDTAVIVDVLANDSDPDGDELSVSIGDGPAHGSVTLVDGGARYVPDEDFHGTDSFTYEVSDGVASSTATVTVTVTPVNDAPTIDPIDDVTVSEGDSTSVAVKADDVDGDSLTITATGLPSFAELVDHGDGTATITLNPAEGSPGSHGPISVTVADPGGETASTTFSLTVKSDPYVNRPPVAAPVKVETKKNTPVEVVLNGSDPDGDALTYTVVRGPKYGTLSGTGATLTYTPKRNFCGTVTFTYAVSDGKLTSETATVTVSVGKGPARPNRAPEANPVHVSTRSGAPVAVTLKGSDPDRDPLTYQVASQPAHGTLSGIAPKLTYTPKPGFTGVDSFTYVVNDGKVSSSPATVTIKVGKEKGWCWGWWSWGWWSWGWR